jgi:hypothetical protein
LHIKGRRTFGSDLQQSTSAGTASLLGLFVNSIVKSWHSPASLQQLISHFPGVSATKRAWENKLMLLCWCASHTAVSPATRPFESLTAHHRPLVPSFQSDSTGSKATSTSWLRISLMLKSSGGCTVAYTLLWRFRNPLVRTRHAIIEVRLLCRPSLVRQSFQFLDTGERDSRGLSFSVQLETNPLGSDPIG